MNNEPKKQPGYGAASGGDRGDAGSSNLEQSRAIGQDDPQEGSRMGREANKKAGAPGLAHTGTNAAQSESGQTVAPEPDKAPIAPSQSSAGPPASGTSPQKGSR